MTSGGLIIFLLSDTPMSDGDASLNMWASVSLKSPAGTIQVFQVVKNYFGFKMDCNEVCFSGKLTC